MTCGMVRRGPRTGMTLDIRDDRIPTNNNIDEREVFVLTCKALNTAGPWPLTAFDFSVQNCLTRPDNVVNDGDSDSHEVAKDERYKTKDIGRCGRLTKGI